MTEAEILAGTLIAVTALPETIAWRNSVGVGIVVSPRDMDRALRVLDRLGVHPRVVRFGLPGSADVLGCSRGRPLAIECKAATGRQSQQQRRFEDAWRAAGGVYVLARSADDAVGALR